VGEAAYFIIRGFKIFSSLNYKENTMVLGYVLSLIRTGNFNRAKSVVFGKLQKKIKKLTSK